MGENMKNRFRSDIKSLMIPAICLVVFVVLAISLRGPEQSRDTGKEFAEYENGTVVDVISDDLAQDEASDGAWRGEQTLTVLVRTGRYKGETLLTYNYVGPLYSVPVRSGDKVTLIISTYADGKHSAVVYEKDRLPTVLILAACFVAACILIGGKSGAKSLLGLLFIVLCLFFVLLPALMKGADTIFATFGI